MKLTKRTVEALPLPDTGQTFHWDDELPGFGIRLTPGSRSYIAQRRVNGKTRRTTIGKHGELTADEARKRARRELVKMGDGTDPVMEKRQERALAVTLREVMNDYLRDRRDLKPSSRADIEKHVTKNLKAWADKPITGITRDKAATRFREMSESGPAQANQCFRNLRALWNYARATYRADDDAPTLPENPVAILSDAKLWNTVKARSGRIPAKRIGKAWALLESLRTDEWQTTAARTAADCVSFLLLTGCRWSEAAQLTWDRVDLEGATWHLPDPKNRNPVTLPLPKPAVALLKARRDDDDPDGYVFPGRSGSGHIRDARGTMAKVSEAAGESLSPHDLRRTFRAVAGECGIELWKTKLLMNHALSGDVTIAHYTETSDLRYLAHESEQIAAWIEAQAKIAKADNVVKLEARA
jgi:integrase